jgi:hypothetical protein
MRPRDQTRSASTIEQEKNTVNYATWSADLRRLATILDELSPDLPEPEFAEQSLRIGISLPDWGDVTYAAKVIGAPVEDRAVYQCATTLDVGTVHVEWFFHDSELAAQTKTAAVSS